MNEVHCDHQWFLFAPAVWVLSGILGAELGTILWAVTR